MLIAAKFQRRRRSVQPALSGKYARSKTAAGAQHNEPLAAIAHDARNVVAALRLYCDLLAEPGVLQKASNTSPKNCRLWPRPVPGWWSS
jgi:hypothetical protein